MTWVRYLVALPFLGLLGGVFFFNRVTPLVFGMPLLLAWIVLWILLTSAIMTLIYRFDPANADGFDDMPGDLPRAHPGSSARERSPQ